MLLYRVGRLRTQDRDAVHVNRVGVCRVWNLGGNAPSGRREWWRRWGKQKISSCSRGFERYAHVPTSPRSAHAVSEPPCCAAYVHPYVCRRLQAPLLRSLCAPLRCLHRGFATRRCPYNCNALLRRYLCSTVATYMLCYFVNHGCSSISDRSISLPSGACEVAFFLFCVLVYHSRATGAYSNSHSF